MLNNANKYEPVIAHEIVQVIMPYIIYRAYDANTKKTLWYEVTHKEPKTFDEKARSPFSTAEAARAEVIRRIKKSKDKKENA